MTTAPVLTTTLRLLQERRACKGGYFKLRKALPKRWPMDKPIDLLMVLDSNGLMDAVWALKATKRDSAIITRLIACDFAEHVQHLYVPKQNQSWRPAKAILAARRYALGLASEGELSFAWAAAADVAYAAIPTDHVANAAAACTAAITYVANAAAAAALAKGKPATRPAEETWQAARLREWLIGERTPETVCAEIVKIDEEPEEEAMKIIEVGPGQWHLWHNQQRIPLGTDINGNVHCGYCVRDDCVHVIGLVHGKPRLFHYDSVLGKHVFLPRAEQ